MVNRDKLLNDYVLEVVEGMDLSVLVTYAIDGLRRDMETLTTDELIAEVEEFYPHLLEEN